VTHPAHTPESDLRELRVLEQIENNPHVSQRQLASELGVALGVANACVNTLVRKGLLKVRGESNRSLTYHLTKQGVLHKAALALEWTNNTITDYVTARATVREQLDALVGRGVARVALLGAEEAAELVALIAPQAGLTVVAAIDAGGRRIADALAGVQVLPADALNPATVDAVLLADRTLDPDTLGPAWTGVPVLALNGQRLERSLT
jgi:DNA-binding MarR family transcriptional regulator